MSLRRCWSAAWTTRPAGPGLPNPGWPHLWQEQGEQKLDTTASVTQAAASVRLETTAPVTQSAAVGGCVVRVVLPKGVTQAAAPEPIDPQV